METKEVTIKGWITRDGDGSLTIYPDPDKPRRSRQYQFWWSCVNGWNVPRDLFPDIKWDSDPKEIEMTIKIR